MLLNRFDHLHHCQCNKSALLSSLRTSLIILNRMKIMVQQHFTMPHGSTPEQLRNRSAANDYKTVPLTQIIKCQCKLILHFINTHFHNIFFFRQLFRHHRFVFLILIHWTSHVNTSSDWHVICVPELALLYASLINKNGIFGLSSVFLPLC